MFCDKNLICSSTFHLFWYKTDLQAQYKIISNKNLLNEIYYYSLPYKGFGFLNIFSLTIVNVELDVQLRMFLRGNSVVKAFQLTRTDEPMMQLKIAFKHKMYCCMVHFVRVLKKFTRPAVARAVLQTPS